MKYKGLQLRVYNLLLSTPQARERRFKDTHLVALITSHWLFQEVAQMPALVNLCQDYTSADRYWRLHLKNHIELRGTDWSDGKKLAQAKQIEIGMEGGYHEVNRKLKQI